MIAPKPQSAHQPIMTSKPPPISLTPVALPFNVSTSDRPGRTEALFPHTLPAIPTRPIVKGLVQSLHMHSSSPLSSPPPRSPRVSVAHPEPRLSRQSSIASTPRVRKRPFAPLTQSSFINPNQYEQSVDPMYHNRAKFSDLGASTPRAGSFAGGHYPHSEREFAHLRDSPIFSVRDETIYAEQELDEGDAFPKRLKVSSPRFPN